MSIKSRVFFCFVLFSVFPFSFIFRVFGDDIMNG